MNNIPKHETPGDVTGSRSLQHISLLALSRTPLGMAHSKGYFFSYARSRPSPS